jgi:ATP-binding cassette subfamily C (CFTR/MRP) protein 1
VSLALFNILRFPMSMLPFLVSMLVEADVARRRITKFLLLEEVGRMDGLRNFRIFLNPCM